MKNQKIYEAMGWDSRTAERDLRDPDSLVSRVVAFVDSLNPSYETRLRDEFAMAALPSIYTEAMRDAREGSGLLQDDQWRIGLALDSYAIADATMQARKQEGV